MNRKIVYIILGVVVVLVLGYSFLWMKSGFIDYRPQTNNSISPSVVQDETKNWKIYRNETFEFKYPENLQLIEDGNKVVLNHSIPYENVGDCDLLGGGQLYETLDDFNVSFEVVNQKLSLNYVVGEYNAGILKGSWALEGAEGCGHSKYHFSIGENKTLVVQRANIQALSGISTSWDLEKILKISGVISKEESEKLFNEILSTFRLVQ